MGDLEYIVIRYSNLTSVVQIQDESIEECTTTPLLLSTPSVFVGMTSDGKFIRVLGDMIVLYNETPQRSTSRTGAPRRAATARSSLR